MLTQEKVNEIAYAIVGCAIEVHRNSGPGLLESFYQECMIEELRDNGLYVESEMLLPTFYKEKPLKTKLKVDLLVNNLIIVELKAVEYILPVFKAQLLTYMKIAEKPKGLLINFNCANITKDGLTPLVNEYFSALPKKNLV